MPPVPTSPASAETPPPAIAAVPPGRESRTAAASPLPPLPPEEIDRIVQSRHDQPHSVLGPHAPADGRAGVVVRAFLPHAERAALRLADTAFPAMAGAELPMRRLHPDGLFEGFVPDRDARDPTFGYELAVVERDGRPVLLRDAYAVTEPWFTADDEALFRDGRHARLHTRLGAHPLSRGGVRGTAFAVWAPHAQRVSVVGSFNRWDGRCHPMRRLPASGVWELFVPHAGEGDYYKFELKTPSGDVFLKTDPFAFRTEAAPKTAAIVFDLDWGFPWLDSDWLRRERPRLARAGSYALSRHGFDAQAPAGDPRRGFRDAVAAGLPRQVKEQGYSHLELLFAPPGLGGSAGLFAPGAELGAPHDLMELIDACHQAGLGVVMPTFAGTLPEGIADLCWFDGTPLYEGPGARPVAATASLDRAPPQRAGTVAAERFDIGRGEVASVLLSNACFWLDGYHADALRSERALVPLLARLHDLAPAAAAATLLLVREPAASSPLPAEVRRLGCARHDDPHALLGPHVEADAALTLRAFLPGAEQVHAEMASEPSLLAELVGAAELPGLFATTLAGANPAAAAAGGYRLHVRGGDGGLCTIVDPYAFRRFAFTDFDAHLFGAGNHYRIYEKLGAHPRREEGVDGVGFAVWAPNAEGVSVVGPFNGWDGRLHAMRRHGRSGVWEIFVPGLEEGELYKFEIRARNGHLFLKTDPFARATEVPPKSASVVCRRESAHPWRDAEWLEQRARSNPWRKPLAIYEVHLGSWRRDADGRPLSYRELARTLVPHVKALGFSHIELLPIAEHPYEPSWGYQVSNFYAPTSRFGSPADLMAFVDACHQEGIGVLLDWVPGHFPKDAHALAWFDGTHLFEHADPRQREHRDWGTLIFNYGRHEVENFLIANALYWLEQFHIDGLRVDAVASMLYLDYSRPNPSDWIPNKYGGRENLEAVEFLRHVNAVVHARFPGVLMIAEESTAWPKVSRPTDEGGLGFGFKWNMGWMHDTLAYFQTPAEHRGSHHGKLTFGLVYAWNENFILSLSHDEVVHLKRSLLGKMPGEPWEKLANLRLLYAWMWTHPGKKLLFMGAELGQRGEWSHAQQLEWGLEADPGHRALAHLLHELNRLYRGEPALHEVDFRSAGFEWLDVDNAAESVVAFLRKAKDPRESLVVVLNLSGISRPWYRLGVPYPVRYRQIFDSNAAAWGGCDASGRVREARAEEFAWHGREFSITLPVPAFTALILRPDPKVG